MRLASLAENAFNAVERIHEYSVAPEEPPAEIPGACPDSWPSKGEVQCAGSNDRLTLFQSIHEYSVAPEEPPAKIPGACPDGWPSKGEVQYLSD